MRKSRFTETQMVATLREADRSPVATSARFMPDTFVCAGSGYRSEALTGRFASPKPKS